MKQVIAVSLGGALGASLRWVLAGRLARWTGAAWAGTLTVNLLGCFAIGLVYGMAESRDWLTPSRQLFLTTGLLGGFTTYSAFGHDAYRHFSDGQATKGILYVTIHVVVGIAAAWAGATVAR